MTEQRGHHIIRLWQQQWSRQSMLVFLLPLLALVLALLTVLVNIAGLSWWWLAAAPVVAAIAAWLRHRRASIKEQEVVRYLDRHYPQLQESTALLLSPRHTHNLLQQLQAQQTEKALLTIEPPQPFRKKLVSSLLLLAGAVLFCLAFTLFMQQRLAIGPAKTPTATQPVKENVLPAIAAVTISVTPPAYTGKPMRSQHQFHIEAEEGAFLRWEIQTTHTVPAVALLFNDSTVLPLKAANTAHTRWEAGRQVNHAGFYQVKLQQQLSELYRLETIRDQAPAIHVQSPQTSTTIDYGQPQQVNLQLSVTDDYGIRDAFITATIASGSGEAVKFKEQQLRFETGFGTSPLRSDLSKTIRLPALGMQPGDELYFYITATDNHAQQTRSDVYIVSLADTAQLMSMDGMVNGVNLKPEYFRSQRQIIIETEQLIRDKDSISTEHFKDKSNSLGIDQKMLRLRYGRFLGEESESNIGDPRLEDDDHDHGGHGETAPDFGNAAKILDQFTDKHDNAEDASFFEPAIKQQLKATLTEMWKAELQLRLFKPQDALPYEYKALRLLKDLQQKSRAYVAKTGIKTTPLKPEKRLTGDLSKIITPLTERQYQAADAPDTRLRSALGWLEQLKAGLPPGTTVTVPPLQTATQALTAAASTAPSRYLASLEALNRITAAIRQHTTPAPADITLAQKGLYQLTGYPALLPAPAAAPAGSRLYQSYFQQLNQHRAQP
jgi:hypothetical protein